MTPITVRRGLIDDADGINGVYNPFIRDTAVTFETVELSLDDRRRWFEAREDDLRYPVVVAETGKGEICGFASASPFDQRAGYATSVKTSVFVDPVCHGKGAGAALYTALFKALENSGVHRAYGLIAAPNPSSAALHKRFGFRHVATLDEVGRKFGRFINVMWFEKAL
ncbi:N-acetyltransferase family protein [Hyphococcus sp.]|uniref:GNAT family N-acetyltransferase n=1 Tax=Hyphococcus sp. TaxID=2038636 RepID=UPI003CCB7561